ncbi:hypothetical protein OH797_01075 [Streptomyces anulatus]|uniref:hypothetical protein n=1 Tax=Streptomyces TaxID=1883 RepID=UPI0006D941F6|nr:MULTISPECIES: hypothetical protein [Streptomyces]KPL30823.1 hypothetical protein JI76_36610 [Streptomyces anulatus]KQX31423.1 hypothetical protein ASD29_16345 [Streptomyces sp. Root1295]KRA41369.1 hypothetical protein ASD97_11165 [Streptomyces sp. Root63]MBT1099953.1 hypothetical protein [Streptomyces sp. Tu10]WSC66094.1 hypothetical protein OHA57_37355 [Streptomyces anulatus]
MSDGEDTVAGADDAVADDALLVLTAMLLTPARFPGVLGDDYVAACGALALEPYEEGYGLVLGQDGEGARWTVVVEDAAQVAVAIAAWDCGMEHDLSPDERSMVCALPGWPMDLAVSAPGVPEPHDPETDGEGPAPLTPPDTEAWGPAQRRLGADEIAAQWSVWREQLDDARFSRPGDEGEPENGVEGEPQNDPSSSPRHPGVRRALSEATAYTKAPPPPGRIRSSYASADARTLRVDGPGWSMVARTDDIALFLLDEEPGTVIPVGRGAALPGLLTALDGLAAQPT